MAGLSDEDLEGAAGAGWGDWVASLLGLAVTCGLAAGISAVVDAVGEENPYTNQESNRKCQEAFSLC